MLADHTWQVKYTGDHGDLVRLFYLPALEDARRYDRLTGYFSAQALTLAARGIESLVRHDGRMRLVVGCTLNPPEIEAILQGEQLRHQVERHLTEWPLVAHDATSHDALELLAWMVQHEFLAIRVAIPCDLDRQPIPSGAIFHEKSGIIEDSATHRIAWTGSLNETGAGWVNNWESLSVFTSWGDDIRRVDAEEANFFQIWEGSSTRVIVMDVPDAIRENFLRFSPSGELPARLKKHDLNDPTKGASSRSGSEPTPHPVAELSPMERMKRLVWSFICEVPSWPEQGERVGEVTCPVDPWPHQIKALERLYDHWPPRLLIADEVGLGKTIQAGLLLRRAWLAGQARRILIMAPKAVMRQWQIELREKFNLNWPIYDGSELVWYESPAMRGRNTRRVDRDTWHRESVVIVSSQLMRRADRAEELLEQSEPWDLVILDEAHHARRRGAGGETERGPNHLLRLMQALKEKTEGLVLLTATPMQVHPIEVWDLLNLLELPPQWSETEFLDFFDMMASPNPSSEDFERMARLFRAVEHTYGETVAETATSITGLSAFQTRNVLDALRDPSSIPRRHLNPDHRQAAKRIMQANTPIRRLVSRHTRELLRRYFREGMLTLRIASRQVEDRFPQMSPDERALYDAVEDYISETYNQTSSRRRTAVGFVMTIYRRRLASSFTALRETLEKRRSTLSSGDSVHEFLQEEDMADDDLEENFSELEETDQLEGMVPAMEEQAEIDHLLGRIKQLPPDTKLQTLNELLDQLSLDGYQQVMVFTQYTDTMDFLREELGREDRWKLMCFSGRGGEVMGSDGSWNRISRDKAKHRFQAAEADILLCTDAAAEGLNFQFCGALVNYDMPWNPMRVEQRIGRIDRLGQEHKTIRIINLHYDDTIETDVYLALEKRIGLFQTVVGRLQPILARIPQAIRQSVLSGRTRDPHQRKALVEGLEREAAETEADGFDFDEVTASEMEMPTRRDSPIQMDDLDRVINISALMPRNVRIQSLGPRVYSLHAPGMDASVRVTTNPSFYEEHADYCELWSPGNPLFVAPTLDEGYEKSVQGKTLKEILDGV